MPDGPLKAQTGDLEAARGKPPGQRVQGLLDVPGGKPFGWREALNELDAAYPGRLR